MATTEELQQQLAALTARVDGITAPPTDYYTSRYSGEEADNGIARALPGGEIDRIRPNRNLLDNWDFRNVINQRGQAAYTVDNAFTFDRWLCMYGTVSVSAEGITIQKTAGKPYVVLSQNIEKERLKPGETYTLSCIFRGNVIRISGEIGETGNGIATSGFTDNPIDRMEAFYNSASHCYTVRFVFVTDSPITIQTIKLELGSVSTLAHDPPADYGAELAKCQRYYQVLEGRAVGHIGFFFIPTSVSMRTAPALTLLQAGTVYAPDGSTRPVTGVSLISAKSNGLDCCIAPDSSFVSGTADWSDFKIAASADL